MTVVHMNQWANQQLGMELDKLNKIFSINISLSPQELPFHTFYLDFSKVLQEFGQKFTPQATANENSDFTSI